MPFAFLIFGIALVISAARGTHGELGALIKKDFTGPGNFVYWLAAIGLVGSLGYINKAQGFSRAFMSLILIAMILSNKGFFAKLQEAIQQLGESGSQGSGPAGNTIDNAQPAPQQPNAGNGGSLLGDAGNFVAGEVGSTGQFLGDIGNSYNQGGFGSAAGTAIGGILGLRGY